MQAQGGVPEPHIFMQLWPLVITLATDSNKQMIIPANLETVLSQQKRKVEVFVHKGVIQAYLPPYCLPCGARYHHICTPQYPHAQYSFRPPEEQPWPQRRWECMNIGQGICYRRPA